MLYRSDLTGVVTLGTVALMMATVSPGQTTCCGADCKRMAGRGVGPPAAFAAPTSDPGHGERCGGEAARPGAQEGGRSLLF